jgi:hypothetical protein
LLIEVKVWREKMNRKSSVNRREQDFRASVPAVWVSTRLSFDTDIHGASTIACMFGKANHRRTSENIISLAGKSLWNGLTRFFCLKRSKV